MTNTTTRAALTLEQQRRLLVRCFKKARFWYKTIEGTTYLCFELKLRPTDVSATYKVFFAYAVDRRPLVWVSDPEVVEEAHGVRTPHLNYDGTLCLYDPAAKEWTSADALVYKTVPWTLRWLFHYEHWLVFGEWLGDPAPQVIQKPQEESVAKGDLR